MEMGRGGSGQHKGDERGRGWLHTRGKKRGATRVGGRKRVGSPSDRDQRPKILLFSEVFLPKFQSPKAHHPKEKKKQRKNKLQPLFFANWVSQDVDTVFYSYRVMDTGSDIGYKSRIWMSRDTICG
jgi:hypothetical protein